MTYEEMKLAYKVIMQAIKNGNSVNPEPFDPNPTEYRLLRKIANELNEEINTMQERYNLK